MLEPKDCPGGRSKHQLHVELNGTCPFCEGYDEDRWT